MRRFLLAAALAALASPACPQAVVVSSCGAKTFTVGSTNYVTMNPQGYLCVSTTTVVTTAREPERVEQPVIKEEPKPK